MLPVFSNRRSLRSVFWVLVSLLAPASVQTGAWSSDLQVGFSWWVQGTQNAARFGGSLATADINGDSYDDVIVGAPEFTAGQASEGRVFVYLGSQTGISTSPSWTAESNQTAGYFGYSVANAGDVNSDGYDDILVGAYHYSNGGFEEGHAFAWYGGPNGLGSNGTPANADWVAPNNQSGGLLGFSVSGAGDVDHDGFADVIVGGHLLKNATGDVVGQALVFRGSAAGLEPEPAWTLEGEQPYANFGWKVAAAGDVNGDGFDDVLVSAIMHDDDANDNNEGRVFVFYGPDLDSGGAWSVSGGQAEPTCTGGYHAECLDGQYYFPSFFGHAIAGDIDVNGDGFSDVVVGAPYYDVSPDPDDGLFNEGRTCVYFGGPGGLGPGPDWTITGDSVHQGLGGSFATGGDTNCDGFAELALFSVIENAYGQPILAGPRLYPGSSSGPATPFAWEYTNNNGILAAAGTMGDVNGDGAADLVLGDPRYTAQFGYQPGGVFAFIGGSGSVTGLVRAGGDPIMGVNVFAYAQSLWGAPTFVSHTSTDASGAYRFDGVPAGTCLLWLMTPLGFSLLDPPDGTRTLLVPGCGTAVAAPDFELQAVPTGGPRKNMVWWRSQAVYYIDGTGPTADETEEAMRETYPGEIHRHFFFRDAPKIDVDGVTNLGGAVMTLEDIHQTLIFAGPMGIEKAKQQFLAMLLNMVSSRLQPLEAVSADGATASQAVQEIDARIAAGDYLDAWKIANWINNNAQVPSGVISLGLPNIAFAPLPVGLPVASGTPNPMTRSCAIAFQVLLAGPAEVSIHDVTGRRVAQLLSGNLERGSKRVTWDGRDEEGQSVSNGVYFFRVRTASGTTQSRLVVLR